MRSGRAALCVLALPLVPALAQNGAHNSRIVGVVSDSINERPLRGAEVVVSGVTTSVTTDSLGKFTIDSLPPGTYQVGVFHPLLESLGITLATKTFVIGPDSAAVVNLSVPSIPTLVNRYCEGNQTASTPSVLAGRVMDPDTDAPTDGARVSLAWTDVTVSKETGVVRTPHELHTESNASGFFKFCALPSGLDGTLQVTKGETSTPEVPVAMSGALLAFQSISVAPKSESRATGIVMGRVMSLDGRPVSGARVEISASGVSGVTREDGGFRLSGIASGTQVLVVRSLSYAMAAEPIRVTSRWPLEVVVTVGPKVNLLDPVLVTARREFALEKSGFYERKRGASGHFFSREDIDRRKPIHISDMLKNLTGFTVSSQTGGTVISGRSRPTSIASSRPSCTRAIIDGFEWKNLQPGDLDMFLNPDDVIGLEVYQPGEEPAKFRTFDRGCVTIVAWTQLRGKASK
jgi:carboxypeptidase family protein